MKILLTEGFAATNVGNEFYRRGCRYLIENSFPEAQIFSIGDTSRNYWLDKKARLNNFELLQYVDVDFLVINGPIFSHDIFERYNDIFEILVKEKKTQLLYISTGGYTYNDLEVNICRSFMEKFPPLLFFSRDAQAYHLYKNYAKVSHNGICTAWFINDYFKGSPVTLEPYITLAFDKMFEPKIIDRVQLKEEEALPEEWIDYSSSKFQRRYKIITDKYGIPLLKKYPSTLNNHKIIRLSHNNYDSWKWKVFEKPNTYVSEVLDGYLELYQNSSLNLTDRVHSAVASLVFDVPTRLFTHSKRANLFERVGSQSVIEKVTVISQNQLTERKKEMFKAITKIL